ncbi:MAG TPA: hypothetical protein VH482_34075 [Thermomicrobiales bacterium]
MTRKAPDTDLDDAIASYVSGKAIDEAARHHHIGGKRLAGEIKRRGLFRGRVARPRTPKPLDPAIADYVAGRGLTEAAIAHHVGPIRLRQELQRRGIYRGRVVRPPVPKPLDAAIADYVSGTTLADVARRHRVHSGRLSAELKRLGIFRGHKGRTAPDRLALPTAEIAARYVAGESEKDLAAAFATTRGTIVRRLADAGVERRTMAEAIGLGFSRMDPEERMRFTAASHAASRGKPKSFETKCLMALTRQRRQLHASPAELLLHRWLLDLGVETTPQLAVGPYNADLAAFPVAVEIYGGHWHGYGRHAARAPERLRHFLDRGWSVVVVHVDGRKWPLSMGAAEYLAAYLKQSRGEPTLRREYRVIRGTGQEMPTRRDELDDLPFVPALHAGKRRRA